RRVRQLICFSDPLGNRLEASWGSAIAAQPFSPGRAVSGFRTGRLGLGHVVLTVKSIDAALGFYRDLLGFRLSDYYDHPFRGYFFHINERHHSFALIETGATGVHHLLLEHFDLDDVGQGYDLASQQEGRVAVTLGRHCGDYMTSFYTRTPSGFMIEHGWGGRLIDPSTWTPDVRTEGPSLWGHDRSWLPPAERARALELRLKNAASGIRRPVQVLPGHHQLMPEP
nr:VOC family protein [Pseudomonadota bacterium]